MMQAMENVYEIWNMKCQKPIESRFTGGGVTSILAEYNLDLVAVQKTGWDEGCS